MKRKFEESLIDWKNNDINKPLMVIGARQIGKTYLINDFCKNNFTDYLYFNLMDNKEVFNIFEDDVSTDKKIFNLEIYLGRKINEDTVMFFDEVQESEKFIVSLKFLCESDFKYKIVCAGSLLGVKLKRFNSSFPAGKVTIKTMHSMNFEEFLMATNNLLLIESIKNSFNTNDKLPESLHNKALELYNMYICIGGMPEAVNDFIEKKLDLLSFDKSIITSIISAYVADMKKYTDNYFETIKIEKVYNNISYQLTKENKKFIYSGIDKNARSRDYESSVDWLLSSNIVLESNSVNKLEVPLKVFKEESNFKLYVNDVGILFTMLDIAYSNILLNENFMYKGAMAENYVAQELISNDIKLYYWSKNQIAKIDFLIDTCDGIIPIEVKASDNTTSKSLNYYKTKYNPLYSIRISTKNFGFENNIKSVPLYATFCIKKY